MNVDRVLEELPGLLALADEVSARDRPAAKRRSYGEPRDGRKRGVYFQKSVGPADHEDPDDGDEPNAHAEAKAAHHARLAALYGRIHEAHSSMVDHYGGGAKGAHTSREDDADVDDAEHHFNETEADEPSEGDVEILKQRAASGDREARMRLVAIGQQAVSKAMRTHHHVGDPSAAAVFLVKARERGSR